VVSNAKSRKFRKSRSQVLHKPGGVIHPRVQAVAPQHFAILCVDCAKNRSKIMLADFYGRVLLQPTTVEHDRPGFQAAINQVRDAQAWHNIKDMIVVVERTGRYHRPIQHAFAKAVFEVRVLHPYATMPRYQKCFDDLFDCESAIWIAKNLGSATAIVQAGIDGLAQRLKTEKLPAHKPTLQKIVAWARSAPPGDEPVSLHRRIFGDLDADRLAKLRLIRAIEAELAEPLCQTPYVLLLLPRTWSAGTTTSASWPRAGGSRRSTLATFTCGWEGGSVGSPFKWSPAE
jgi:hypothetical protein